MEIRQYTFTSGLYSFSILNLGCAVTAIRTPDRCGRIANVTLPFIGTDPDVILRSSSFFGMTIGRFANRIAGASFPLSGKTWSFAPNDGPNLLHSGKNGIWSKIWDIKPTPDGYLCTLSATQAEDGFPGDATITVRFSLTAGGDFTIRYTASCTAPCPFNLTNHTYFNLTGDPARDILSHTARINSSSIVDAGPGLIPTGRLLPTRGTAWDFTAEKPIGRDIDSPELAPAGGYDHAFVLSPGGPFVRITEPQSGRVLEGFTDMPAVHFYTGNYLDGEFGYHRRHGFCLETEFYPDCVNRPEFPSCVVRPGETFESTTLYRFTTC